MPPPLHAKSAVASKATNFFTPTVHENKKIRLVNLPINSFNENWDLQEVH